MNAPRHLSFIAFFAGIACSGPGPEERRELLLPSFEQFLPVGEALGARCGSLDCHGSVGRNLRLYDGNGLRLDADLVSGGGLTTAAELAANYRSVVLLEPELTSRVFQEGGARPERLTIVRKGRGTENHEGGIAMTVNGATDICLVSYLAGAVHLDACAIAAEVTRPAQP